MENAKQAVLLIDDDEALASLLERYLERFSFELKHATSGTQGIRKLKANLFDCVILDVMLPHEDGFVVLAKIRAFSDIPVLMLTARGEVTDRVIGLEKGADDYMPKPFEPRELVARIQSITRRRQGIVQTRFQAGPLLIDATTKTVWQGDKEISLSSSEFDVLTLLAQKPGRVFTRDNILAAVRGSEWNAEDRSVDILVSRLRQKLGDDTKHSKLIKTIWGSGYTFVGKA